jgi:hypothetical protein
MAFMMETMAQVGTMANEVKALRLELSQVETGLERPTMDNPAYREIVAKYSRTIAHINGIQSWSIGENYPFHNDNMPADSMLRAITEWRMSLLNKIMANKMSIMLTMAKLGANDETIENILRS